MGAFLRVLFQQKLLALIITEWWEFRLFPFLGLALALSTRPHLHYTGFREKFRGLLGVTRVIPADLLSTPDVMLLGLNWFNKMTHIIFIPEQFFNYSSNKKNILETKKFVSE